MARKKRSKGALTRRPRRAARVVYKRARSRARSTPKPQPQVVVKFLLAQYGGRLLRRQIDIPYVSEEAVAALLLQFFGGSQAERQTLMNWAVALSVQEGIESAGVLPDFLQ